MLKKYISFISFLVIGLLSTSPALGENPQTLKPLSSCQIMRVCGEAGLSSENYYAGNLYNGNKDIFITEISVYVRTKKDGELFPRIYSCRVDIAPLTKASFGFTIVAGDKNSDYTWGIIEAKGYKV